MALTPEQAEQAAAELFGLRGKDERRLTKIKEYMRGEPKLVWLPLGTPRELQALAQMSRVNMMDLVVKATTQQMFVDGYVSDDDTASEIVWGVWQRNRWDRKQIGVHRATATYGVAYGVNMPSQNGVPSLRPVSPCSMTAAYGFDEDWPKMALEDLGGGWWRLYDSTYTYDLTRSSGKGKKRGAKGRGADFEFVPGSATPHDQDVTPVVRYVSDEDLDCPVRGDVEPLFTLQDQVNLITFHLMVAEHYGAHGRKVIIGRMVKELETKLVKASGNTMMTINAEPGDVNIQELSQTDLNGFLESRQSALRMMSAISQTPAHELLGNLANLAAAALVENRESTARKIQERQIVIGESHEQLLGQAGSLLGLDPDPMARIRWKPTLDQRSVQLVNVLDILANKLGVPAEALWGHLPFSSSDIRDFKKAAEGDEEPPSVDPENEPAPEEDGEASEDSSTDPDNVA